MSEVAVIQIAKAQTLAKELADVLGGMPHSALINQAFARTSSVGAILAEAMSAQQEAERVAQEKAAAQVQADDALALQAITEKQGEK